MYLFTNVLGAILYWLGFLTEFGLTVIVTNKINGKLF